MKLEITITKSQGMASTITVSVGDSDYGGNQILSMNPMEHKTNFIDLGLVSAAVNFGKRKLLEKLKQEQE